MQNPEFKCCIIIGAGPAGMTAALYLNRFYREITVLDAGCSRARWIPKTHNCPGFPDGLSGDELLERMRLQAENYGTRVIPETASQIQRVEGGFSVSDTRGGQYLGRTVLLATGAEDILPPDPWVAKAVGCGALRLCAICDGFEASDDNIAVYGPLRSVFDHARFMRTYSASVTLVQSDTEQVDAQLCQSAEKWGITLMKKPRNLLFDGSRCGFIDESGTRRDFDTIYVMLGSRSQAALAIELGAHVDKEKKLVVNTDQMTSIDGLFAIGDVVSALSQLSVAAGHAAVAATAIHNMLPRNLR
ncbi:NAD(P)/FAD-dependent oxidoreductase [Alteromonas pelagimontana]|uniref:NAD(P)/FAD-dependent oxidoreductase n=1 Tax=Alteromonas pelagimontana TaxID=1858656 RepID=A0A6M4MFP0_9ALTE|nr:NAD(P)/FAD-dependent oxidoreductase [Alteromonas pelagimontana]QJR81480.1 NAD(P)/FAD-dependent oxidoreductase [Alteromonas pelagimontana]